MIGLEFKIDVVSRGSVSIELYLRGRGFLLRGSGHLEWPDPPEVLYQLKLSCGEDFLSLDFFSCGFFFGKRVGG
jgi:hypothetical protein